MASPLILLVEDNAVFRRSARTALEAGGYTVAEAKDGSEALGLARGDAPCLLLLDTTLPDFTARDLLRRLRALPGCADLPAVAMPGLFARPEEEGLTAAGFDDFLVKPVDGAVLLEVVASHLGAGAAARGRPGRGRLVLVADDDPDHRALARIRLTLAGFVVETASDGQEALEKARARVPDVIASDILMPRLDGLGLCMAVRRDAALQQVPVVLFSGNYLEKADQRLARDAGATDFVIRSGEMKELVEKIVERSGGGAAAPAPASPESVETERRNRASRQLERQAALNISLARRSRLQEAQLSILAAVSEGLAGTGDLDAALREGFAGGFDAWALCPAALFTLNRKGLPVFRARSGWTAEAEPALEGFLGHREFAARALEGDVPLVLRPTGDRRAPEDDFLDVAGARSALVVPLRAARVPVGVLLLASPRDDLDDAEVKSFAVTVAGQLAQAVSLAAAAGRLRSSEERYRAIVENANDALFLLDPGGEVLEVNRRGEEILGRSSAEIVGRRLRDFASPDAPDTGWQGLERVPAGEPVRLEPVQVGRPDGTGVPVELSASLVRAGGRTLLLAIARDVSRRRALERRLYMAQKMEAVGQLAGGIAHDFNNLLMVINGYAEILLGRTGEGRPGRREMEEILRAGQRAAALTSQLLGFSRRQVVRPRVMDLPAATGALEEELRRLAGPAAALSFLHAEGQKPVKIDPVQFEQVLVQLVLNASEALPAGGGTVAVETGSADLDEAFVAANEGARAGPHLFLSVRDEGRGMDEETLSRCFEPFFSTKEPGKGSGLGLATVYGVVKQNDGYVRVESGPGKGTRVTVYLPPVEPVEATPGVARAPAGGAGGPAAATAKEGAGTVLVIEDEWAVRTLVHQVLRGAGYAVLQAESGEDALELAMKHGAPIDLVLSDVVMKGMGGRETVKRLRAERPGLKALFMSGYSYDALVFDEGAELGEEFLPKPFSTEELLLRVEGILRPAPKR